MWLISFLVVVSSYRKFISTTGTAAAVFHVRSGNPADPVRYYTVEPGKQLTGSWSAASSYDLSVYGPNGFARYFKGNVSSGAAALSELVLTERRRNTRTQKSILFVPLCSGRVRFFRVPEIPDLIKLSGVSASLGVLPKTDVGHVLLSMARDRTFRTPRTEDAG